MRALSGQRYWPAVTGVWQEASTRRGPSAWLATSTEHSRQEP